SLIRRAADVRQRVERMDVLEDDRLQLESPARGLTLEAVQHRLAEPPLHDRVDGGELLLDLRLDASVQLLHASLYGHREERQDLMRLGELRGVEIAGIRRAEPEGPDGPVLVAQRRGEEAADAVGDQVLFDRRRRRQRGQVADEDRAAFANGALVERSG